MSNPYFTFTGQAIAGQTARSGLVNSDYQSVQAGFDAVRADILQCFRTSGRTPGANDLAIPGNAAATAGKFVGFDATGNVVALLNALLSPRGAWVTGRAYGSNDLVTQGPEQSLYVCIVPHTSGTFATDLGSGDWLKILDNTSAYQASFRGQIITFSQSPFQSTAGDDLLVDVTAGPVAIALPPSPTISGQPVGITHLDGNIAANNITVGRNGNLIMKLAEDMLITIANASVMMGYSDGARGWRLIHGT